MKLRNGKGNKQYTDSQKLTLNMVIMTMINRLIKLIPYNTAGPRYILTLLTSSEILDIRSPILFDL